VDVVRVLTFAAVIAVHTVSETNPATSVAANSVVMLLHFTREAFFCLTGFVLVHQYLDRQVQLVPFWRRRFLLVGVPYLVWTVLYSGLHWVQSPRTMSFAAWLQVTWRYAYTGTAWFHMYFLLVSMQIYLLYPLIAALVRATRRHHGLLLAVSAVLQVTVTSLLRYTSAGRGWTGTADVVVFAYQFYVLLGAVVADHLQQCATWLRTHRRQAVVGLIVAGAAAEACYAVAVAGGVRASDAATVWQPVMVPWSVAAVVALAALGSVRAQRRRPGQLLDRTLRVGSDRSFGVYLVHPAVLWLVLWPGGHWLGHHLHGAALTAVAYLLTVAGAIAVTEALRRSPLSLPMTGRPRRRPSPAPEHPPTTGPEVTNHALDCPDLARA
jgi:peptidoglycan/LPS O-acetylase OafA/YrhL